ncbi:MAG: hypothetical protein AB1791_04225 [Chloroflexota bacterium]
MNTVFRLLYWLEKLLALVGAAVCVGVPLLFIPGQQPLYPLPGLYFLEIVWLGLVALVSLLVDHPSTSWWTAVPHGAAGVLLAFVVLGAWTIGFFLAPACVAFLLAGVSADRRRGRPMIRHLVIFLIAAFAQAGLMAIMVVINF